MIWACARVWWVSVGVWGCGVRKRGVWDMVDWWVRL